MSNKKHLNLKMRNLWLLLLSNFNFETDVRIKEIFKYEFDIV